MVRAFIEHGDRTDRNKARLKYVLDAMGVEKFLGLLEEKLGRKFDRAVPGAVAPRPAFDRTAHIGIHAQKQAGLNWIGVALPVGRMSVAQMRGLAAIARDFGDGDLRLTVWQNLLISGVPTESLAAAQERIEALGLAIETNAIRSGLVACTGNTGCKFAASDTKRHAEEIARWCETRVALDTPVNIHLTGCHHSCAQHFVSEIGLLACKVQTDEDADPVEGYHIHDRRRLRTRRRARPRTLSRCCRGRRAAHRRAHSQGLSRAPRFARGKLPRLCAAARDRSAQSNGRARGRRMSMTPRPPIPSLIPESAPFTPEQRTWLNGLFAGLFGLRRNITPLSAAEAAKLMPGLIDGAVAPVPAEADDGAPWHDPAMPLPERMKLADGKPLPRRLMAAMATTGLRPVRLQLPGLCGRAVRQIRKAAQSLRTRRQRNRAHAQRALSGA